MLRFERRRPAAGAGGRSRQGEGHTRLHGWSAFGPVAVVGLALTKRLLGPTRSLTARTDDDLLRQDLAAVRRGYFLTKKAMTAPGANPPLTFRGLLTAIDPMESVRALESSHPPHPATTVKPPFNSQRCYPCPTGSPEAGAATGCRMASVGSRPGADGRGFSPKPTLTGGRSTVSGHPAGDVSFLGGLTAPLRKVASGSRVASGGSRPQADVPAAKCDPARTAGN